MDPALAVTHLLLRPQVLCATAVALVAAAASTAPAASHWIDYCDAAGAVHVAAVGLAALACLSLGWVAVTQLILKSDGTMTRAELFEARDHVLGLAGWRVMLAFVILLPKTFAEAALIHVFFSAVIAASVLVRVIKGRWAAFDASGKSTEPSDPVRGRFALAFAACAAAGAALACCVVCIMANSRTPLVLLIVDPATLLLNAGRALTHVGIVARDAGTLGGWDLRIDAAAFVDFAFELAINLCSAVHYAAVWHLRGYGVTSIIEIIVLMHLSSCVSALVRQARAYAAFRSHSQAVEASFPDASSEQLGAGSDCPVCFEAMSAAGAGGRVKVLPQCGHAFHWRCLRRWLLGGHDTCPICRTGLTRAPPPQPRPAAAAEQQQQPRGVGAAIVRFLRMWEHYAPLAARRRPEEIAAALATLTEMFPQLSPAALRHHLVEVAHGDLWLTANAAAAGLIEQQDPGAGTAAAPPAQLPQGLPQPAIRPRAAVDNADPA